MKRFRAFFFVRRFDDTLLSSAASVLTVLSLMFSLYGRIISQAEVGRGICPIRQAREP
jgi:hypothetical protein